MSDDWNESPDPQTLGRALDKRILALTSGKTLSPMVRLAFDGATGTADLRHIADQMPAGNPSASKRVPLDFFRYQAKDCLDEWEYLAGQRFRQDFDLVHASASSVVNYERGAMFATAAALKQQAAGWYGKGASRTVSAYEISHARIDAMQRRGAFASGNRTSFWLAEAIIGFEFWPKEIAAHFGMDARYIGPRFREALWDLAGFYRIHVMACPRPRQVNAAGAEAIAAVMAKAEATDANVEALRAVADEMARRSTTEAPAAGNSGDEVQPAENSKRAATG